MNINIILWDCSVFLQARIAKLEEKLAATDMP